MQKPINYRGSIPLFYDKSSEEYRLDPYERYDPMVIRQTMIHLCDPLWGKYAFDNVLKFILDNISAHQALDILEIGCGVGRMIADLASQLPDANCWGIDYSYQMLKRAKEVWIDSERVEVDLSRFGFDNDIIVPNLSLTNLNFGLAKCESLPFDDDSQDVVFSSFLFDRLSDPLQGLMEMKRVLRPNGKIIMVTPLNFQSKENWSRFYPIAKLKLILSDLDMEVLECQENLIIYEPMDVTNNNIRWNCVAMVLS